MCSPGRIRPGLGGARNKVSNGVAVNYAFYARAASGADETSTPTQKVYRFLFPSPCWFLNVDSLGGYSIDPLNDEISS